LFKGAPGFYFFLGLFSRENESVFRGGGLLGRGPDSPRPVMLRIAEQQWQILGIAPKSLTMLRIGRNWSRVQLWPFHAT
jgi:hypothetical protein